MKKRKLELKKEVLIVLNPSAMDGLRGGEVLQPLTDNCPSQGIQLCKTNPCGNTDLCKLTAMCKLTDLCVVKTDPSVCHACIPATEYKCESVQICVM